MRTQIVNVIRIVFALTMHTSVRSVNRVVAQSPLAQYQILVSSSPVLLLLSSHTHTQPPPPLHKIVWQREQLSK